MSRTSLTVMGLLALACAVGAPAQSPEPAAPAAAPGTSSATAAPADTGSSAASAEKLMPTPAAKGAAPAGPTDASKEAAGVARGAKGNDKLELGTTEISGNRELPKVLYVVPWRRAEIGDAVGRPPNSLVEEALSPVDRDVFRRQNRYYATLQAGAAPAKSQPAAGGGVRPHAAPKDER